jgi:hypothetical protein
MTFQGAHKAKEFVNTYLESDLPDRLIAYRNAWNLDDEELPEPLKYLAYEPIAIDHWPTLITVAISVNQLTRSDYTFSMDPKYRIDYNMRTYVWVKDDNSELCTLKRDRLTAVLRSAILDGPSLNRCGTETNLEVLIDENSLSEEYSDLTLIKGERVMAGAYIGYTLTLTEVLTRKVIAESAEDIQLYELLNVGLTESLEDI